MNRQPNKLELTTMNTSLPIKAQTNLVSEKLPAAVNISLPIKVQTHLDSEKLSKLSTHKPQQTFDIFII